MLRKWYFGSRALVIQFGNVDNHANDDLAFRSGCGGYVMVTQFLLKMIKSLNMGLEHTLAGK